MKDEEKEENTWIQRELGFGDEMRNAMKNESFFFFFKDEILLKSERKCKQEEKERKKQRRSFDVRGLL